MKWKKYLAYLSTDIVLGSIAAALVHFIGQEQCNSQTWQEELYMYILHQRKLEMCLSPNGEFHVGLEAVAEWMPYQTPSYLLTLMVMLMLVTPIIFSQIWKFASNISSMLLAKLKRAHNGVNRNAGTVVYGDVDISFDSATMVQLMKEAGGKDVDIVLDYDVILKLMEYADDGDVELVVDL